MGQPKAEEPVPTGSTRVEEAPAAPASPGLPVDDSKYADSKRWPIHTRVGENGIQVRTGPHSLSDAQIERFAECKALLIEKRKEQGWTEGQPLLRDNMKLTDDDLLLRFFVAHHYKIEDAVRDALYSVEWRQKEGIESIFQWAHDYFPADLTTKTNTNGLCGFYGLDDEGYPVWWDRPNHKGMIELVEKYSLENALRWHFACVERGREIAKWLNVDRITIVLDLQDVSAANVLFGNTGTLLRAQAKVDQVVYPELMRKLFIINAPWGFASAWSGLKMLLDKGFQDKISITGKRAPNDPLSKYVQPDQCPKEFGGEAEIDWGVCGMRLDPSPLIFQSQPYLDRVKELEGHCHSSHA